MPHTSPRALARVTAGVLAAGLSVAGLVGMGATTASAAPPSGASRGPVLDDLREPGPEVTQRSSVRLSKKQQQAFASNAQTRRGQDLRSQAAPAATGTPIGGQKDWLVHDELNGDGAATYVLPGGGGEDRGLGAGGPRLP